MGVEEISSYRWSCDYCGATKVLAGDDQDPPYLWVTDGVLAFCVYSHQIAYHKLNAKKDL